MIEYYTGIRLLLLFLLCSICVTFFWRGLYMESWVVGAVFWYTVATSFWETGLFRSNVSLLFSSPFPSTKRLRQRILCGRALAMIHCMWTYHFEILPVCLPILMHTVIVCIRISAVCALSFLYVYISSIFTVLNLAHDTKGEYLWYTWINTKPIKPMCMSVADPGGASKKL